MKLIERFFISDKYYETKNLALISPHGGKGTRVYSGGV